MFSDRLTRGNDRQWLFVPAEPDAEHLDVANGQGRAWCDEVNARPHSEICAIPAERLVTEVELLGPLPSLRPRIGRVTLRKVDKLSCVRIGSARYSVPGAPDRPQRRGDRHRRTGQGPRRR